MQQKKRKAIAPVSGRAKQLRKLKRARNDTRFDSQNQSSDFVAEQRGSVALA